MNQIEAYYRRRIVELFDIQYDFMVHERLWGVPCGPTLSMIHVTVKDTLIRLIRMDGLIYLKEKKNVWP